MTKKRFESLDAFRGLCAIFVVIFHMHLIGSVTEHQFFRGSWIFVEFFFVLSGFVLTHGYAFKDNLKFTKFMKARFYRIYPLHFFMFIVFVILELGKLLAYKYGGMDFNNEPFTNSYSVSEMIPNLLLIQSWTPFTNYLSFNKPSWSISIEFYIYALLFFSVLIFKKYKIISWLIISILSFTLIIFQADILLDTVLRGLSCFFGGAFTYVIYKNLSNIKPSFLFGSITETVLIVLIVLIVQSEVQHRSVIASVLFCITVLFFAFESGVISTILKTEKFQRTGTLSYSIYMTHTAILFCLTSTAMILQKVTGIEMAPMVEKTRFLDFGSSFTNNLIVILIISTIVYISSLTYKYVELPGQNINKNKKSSYDSDNKCITHN